MWTKIQCGIGVFMFALNINTFTEFIQHYRLVSRQNKLQATKSALLFSF